MSANLCYICHLLKLDKKEFRSGPFRNNFRGDLQNLEVAIYLSLVSATLVSTITRSGHFAELTT